VLATHLLDGKVVVALIVDAILLVVCVALMWWMRP
jgi:hypothetical protein